MRLCAAPRLHCLIARRRRAPPPATCPLPPPLAPRHRRAHLAAEQQRREEAESRLARAQENNTALARNNLRLQEQLARLRGEADVRQHEVGCLRAAAAARAHEAAAKLARLQAQLQRAAADREALLRHLAGKEEVVAYLEGRLAAELRRVHPAPAPVCPPSGAGRCEAGGCDATADPAPEAVEHSEVSADSVAAVGAAGKEQVQEEEEAPEADASGTSSSSGSPPMDQRAPAAQPGGHQHEAVDAVGDATVPDNPQGDTSPPTADVAPTADASPLQAGRPTLIASGSGNTAATLLRSSLRPRNSVSYMEPSLRSKLRQGDACTFGTAAEAAPAGSAGAKPRSRARTKPRPRFAGGGRRCAVLESMGPD